MLNSPVLETVLSLTVVILIFSILVTCVQEGRATLTRSRSKMLEMAIGEVLNDKFNKNFAYLLYQHPQIDLLKRKQGELPSYIDADTFAAALIDLIAKESTETVYLESPDKSMMQKKEQFTGQVLEKARLESGLEALSGINEATNPQSTSLVQRFWMGADSMRYSDLKKLLLSFEPVAAGMSREQSPESLEHLKTQIKKWYNNYMDRVTGWYKRKIRKNLFFAATAVTLFFNLNFITLSRTIYADSKLRSTISAMADTLARENAPLTALRQKLGSDTAYLGDININAIIGAELPIGWKMQVTDTDMKGKTMVGKALAYTRYFFSNHFTVKNIAGWIIFILALSLGAPFWFDVMKKLVNIRNAGKAPQSNS